MNKQTPVQLFLAIFLRAAVAILGVVICVFGIFFLTKYVKNGSKSSGTQATTADPNVLTEVGTHDDLLMNTTASATDAASGTDATATTETETSDSKDKMILILNSTDQAGLAGGWCVTLNEKGYLNTDASDYDTKLTTTKIIAKQSGDGKDLINYFNNPRYEIGTVDEGTSFETGDYDIVIILGTNDQTEEVESTEYSSDEESYDDGSDDDYDYDDSYDDGGDDYSDDYYYDDDYSEESNGNDYSDDYTDEEGNGNDYSDDYYEE